MQGSNFRTSDPGLAVVWPAVEADIVRIAGRPALTPLPPTGKRHWYERVLRLRRIKVGDTRKVLRADAQALAIAAELASGNSYYVHYVAGRFAYIERLDARKPTPPKPSLMTRATVRVEPMR